MIRIADRSEFGWATVEEYEEDELADNSDDEKRLYRAELRAGRRIKAAAAKNKKKKDGFRKEWRPRPQSLDRVLLRLMFSSPPPPPQLLLQEQFQQFKALGLVFCVGKWGILEEPALCCKVIFLVLNSWHIEWTCNESIICDYCRVVIT